MKWKHSLECRKVSHQSVGYGLHSANFNLCITKGAACLCIQRSGTCCECGRGDTCQRRDTEPAKEFKHSERHRERQQNETLNAKELCISHQQRTSLQEVSYMAATSRKAVSFQGAMSEPDKALLPVVQQVLCAMQLTQPMQIHP